MSRNPSDNKAWQKLAGSDLTAEQRWATYEKNNAHNKAQPRGPEWDASSGTGEIELDESGNIVSVGATKTWTRESDRPCGNLKQIISEGDSAARG